jgi:hypothetical protein
MEVIGSPERWTKNTFARDSDGFPTEVKAKDAVCFCSIGAMEKVKGSPNADFYLYKSVQQNSIDTVVEFNDSPRTKHKHVMNLFMTAAFLALSEGK